jgi:uncharacterized membrane protein YcfT
MTPTTIEKKTWQAKAFNTPLLKKSRLPWVDYLKGIAILLVVYRHVVSGIQLSGTTVPSGVITANMIFFSFRMPLFFLLSGLFIGGSLAKRTTGQLIYNKFETLVYPYLVWAVLLITLEIPLSRYTNSPKGLINYTYILYQPREVDQLWCLPALFNINVVFLLVKTKLKARPWMNILLGLALYFIAPFLDRYSMISDWMTFYLFFVIGNTIAPFFFRESVQNFFKNPWSLLMIAIPFFLTQFYYLQHQNRFLFLAATDTFAQIQLLVISLIGCGSMFFLAFQLQRLNILAFLRILGFHSLYIYVMHVPVASCVRIVLKNIFHVHAPLVLLTIGLAMAVTLPVVIYNLFIFEGPLWWLFFLKKYKTRPAQPAPIPSTTLT